MARKKRENEESTTPSVPTEDVGTDTPANQGEFDEIADDLDGTVEGLARDRFEAEKAAYEQRTGERVQFVPPLPVTRTPVKPETEESTTPSSEADDTPPIQEGSRESEAETGSDGESEGEETE